MGHQNRDDSFWHNKGQEDASSQKYDPPQTASQFVNVLLDTTVGGSSADDYVSAREHYDQGHKNSSSK